MDDVREKLVQAAIEVLQKDGSSKKITARFMAEKIGVSPGLVIYHFKTMKSLIAEASLRILYTLATTKLDDNLDSLATFQALADFCMDMGELGMFLLKQNLNEDPVNRVMIILPKMRQDFPHMEERELRLKAFELVVMGQTLLVHAQAIKEFLGMDLGHQATRNELWKRIFSQISQSTISLG